ncbi:MULTISPECIES: AlpA family phage regulatory protein [Arenibacter]|jgi:predicted DNA-binding transcriptional regulator AlpA|uniref:Excisionase n=1 Tax=Arenibacter algicola TaxID=616991 RepID=A0A221USQ5_9FLAO|nr:MULTISPECIES: AlpA family phage regulatory protein [Arenibacter]ASO03951.1 excisionase [Arenibacter algicola]MCK0136446.1 AlpA family transcriptional regulator [Arenibacter sp. S6351L]
MNEPINVMSDPDADKTVVELLKEIKGLMAFNKKVLNLEDLVQYTGMSESTIYKLSRLNLIPKGDNREIRKLFFEKDRIDDWLLGKPDVSDEYLEQKFNEQLLKNRRR